MLNSFSLEDYESAYILNYDETMITRDSIDSKTLCKKGEKDVKVVTSGKEKQGYALGITCTLIGTLLKSLLIWPSTGKKRFQTLTPFNIWFEYRSPLDLG